MVKSKFTKIIFLTICVSMLFATVALADTAVVQANAAQKRLTVNQDDLLEKQKEIDSYLFEEHKDEIAEKGFTVTHTAPMDGYVEIGITPYTEGNAEYLYGIFGRDMVKVVEGQQAELYTANTATATTAAEEQPVDSNKTYIYVTIAVAAGLVIAVGCMAVVFRRQKISGR